MCVLAQPGTIPKHVGEIEIERREDSLQGLRAQCGNRCDDMHVRLIHALVALHVARLVSKDIMPSVF